ncbi:MAG: PEP-utilizing enzyme [Acidimicrobiales bacterium]
MAGLRAAGDEPEFFAALHDLLAEFGRRAEGWDVGMPRWSEMGPAFWNQLASVARPGAPDPDDAVAAGATRREALVAKVEDALADDEKALGQFRRRLEQCQPYVAVREDRAKWQLISVGSLRGAVLRRGAALADAGLIDVADDVLFLTPEVVDAPEAGLDRRGLIAARRSDHDRWTRLVPPTYVGGPVPEPADGRPGPVAPPRVEDTATLLHGISGSRGVATGRARVITDLDAAHDFEPGDVLVCVMTSPPWTPLFGLAAAVVTDSGDAGSHAAIAAREYGIPCVLGTTSATTLITDGAQVTVDGDSATVTIQR